MSEEDKKVLEEELDGFRAKVKEALSKGHPRPSLEHPAVTKIIKTKERFYLGYDQVVDDIKYLTKTINDSIENGELPTDSRISLWGFSIGGLGVLGRFFEEPNVYHSCVLVHSGANIETLGHYDIILTKAQWDKLRKFWHHIAEELRKGNYLVLEAFEAIKYIKYEDLENFAMIFLGLHRNRLLNLSKANSNKLLIFIGGLDKVVPLDAVITTLSPTAGLAIHTLPGLRHNIHDFRKWLNYETEVIKDFLYHHP